MIERASDCNQRLHFRFCGVYNDDRRFFGLVTTQLREEAGSDTNSSCHVFMVEPVTNQTERQMSQSTCPEASRPQGDGNPGETGWPWATPETVVAQ